MSHPRKIRIDGAVAYVPLTRGYEAIIDIADVQLVCDWNWRADVDMHTVYAVRGFRTGGRQITVAMHRQIMNAPKGIEVDHINSNGLDNRRSNLRLANRSENMRNICATSRNTSGFKGVTWHKAHSKWQAQITLNRKTYYLGLRETPAEAHALYCEASKKLHGEFSRTG